MNKVLLNKNADELKQAMFIVMEPDEVDLHGDITSAEEIRKACFNFNLYCQKPNLFHLSGTDTFDFVESYIAPVDMQIGEQVIKAGTWLATVQVYDDTLWDCIKTVEVAGLSIGALATVEEIE